MFFICSVLICVLEIASAYFLEMPSFEDALTRNKIELVLLAAAAVSSSGSMRDRSVLDVFFLWVGWVLVSDWGSYFPPILSSYESVFFTVLAAWVYFRPYRFIQAPIEPKNVCIAFYGGPNAPFLSRLASHAGFPFSSIALVVSGVAIRPSKATGGMVETTPAVLRSKGYVMVNTGIKSTPEIYGKMKGIIGTKTGYGFLRTRCLKNMMPVLECLGPQWQPEGWPVIPSLFYKQCVRNVTNG